jgi:signal transduction histidine kinase
MSWRWAVAIAAVGTGGTLAAAAFFHMPAHEALELAGIAGGAAIGTGAAGAVLIGALRRRPFGVQAAVLGVVAVATVGIGALATARAMFISGHDLHSLLVILLAAGTVSVLVATILGHRVAAASRALGAAARRIGHGELSAEIRAPAAGEFESLARELGTMSHRLDEARRRERELEASRRELTAWVSHDLRTPLAGIRAMAEALEDRVVNDPETVARYHRTLRVESDRLSRLVDELFEVSVIQAGALEFQTERGSLRDLVSDAISAASPAADARGIRLEGRMDDTVSELDLSPSAVTRVLRNLLENAIHHTPNDGSVLVEAGQVDDLAVVSVRDECGGIPQSDLVRVFEPAFRGEAARTPGRGSGAGLGLAIARGIVEAHHGEITVRNEDGGCRFTIRLPLRQTARGG